MVIFEGEELFLHYHKGDSDYIIITFMGAYETNTAKENFFLKPIVEKNNISCLGITTKVDKYYLHPEMESIFSLCEEITKDYQKIIVIGLSMAGYAALKYSKRFKADIVFAMAPRCTLDAQVCPLAHIPRTVAETMHPDQIKQSTIRKDDLGGKIYIAYDPLSPAWDCDQENVDFICSLSPEIIRIPVFFTEHNVIIHLQGTDVFQSIINSLAHKNDQDIIKTITYVRRHHIINIISKTNHLMKRYPYLIYKMLTSTSFANVRKNHILLNNYQTLLLLCFHLKDKGYQQESSDCLNGITLLKIGNYNNLPKPYQPLPNINPYPYLINFHGYFLVYNYQTKKISSTVMLNDTACCLPIQLYNQNGKFKLICIYHGSIFELQHQDNLSFSLIPLSDSYTNSRIKLSFSGHIIYIHITDKKRYIGINMSGELQLDTQPLEWESFVAVPIIFSTQTMQQNSLSVNLNNHQITISVQ